MEGNNAGTLLQRKRTIVKISKQESLLILRAYANHPTQWGDVLEEIRQNLDTLSPRARQLYQTGTLAKLRDRMSNKISCLLKQRQENIQDLDIRNAVAHVRDIETRLIPDNQARHAPAAPEADARDVIAAAMSSDSEDEEAPQLDGANNQQVAAPPADGGANRPAVAPQAGRGANQLAAAPQAVGGANPPAAAPQAVALPAAEPQAGRAGNLPAVHRRRRRIPLAELIRQNQQDYQEFIRVKIPRLMRELGVPDM